MLTLAAAAVFGLAACEKTADKPTEPKKDTPKADVAKTADKAADTAAKTADKAADAAAKPAEPAKPVTPPPAKEPATDEVINAPVDDAPAPPPKKP
jgi:hypothetical protein